jgi:CHAD domain-containing protein
VAAHFTAAIDDTLLQWRTARRRVLRSGASTAAVHAWRISTRRLLALEQLLATRRGRARATTLHEALHKAFHAAGALRDNQIAIRELRALTPRFPAAARLARHLLKRLPRRRHRVAVRIRAIKPRALRTITADWRDTAAPEFERVARARAARRLALASRALRTAIHRGQSGGALHRQRIQLKLLRYMAELCGTGTGQMRRMVAAAQLARRQAQLGRITDLRMLLGKIDRYGRRHPRWGRAATSLRVHLRRRQRRLGEEMHAVTGV